MKKEVNTLEEAEAIVHPLMAENKWAITVLRTPDCYVVQWIEHKKYTALDGAEYFDEVWTTQDGEMKLIQDLDPEHARNIIRMMLRQERESKAVLDETLARIAALHDAAEDEYGIDSAPATGTLH